MVTSTWFTSVEQKERRERACQTVLEGLQEMLHSASKVQQGILEYHAMGLTLSHLWRDLQEFGYDKSKRTLQRHAQELRAQGHLPATNRGRKKSTCHVKPEPYVPLVKRVVELRENIDQNIFSVSDVDLDEMHRQAVDLIQAIRAEDRRRRYGS